MALDFAATLDNLFRIDDGIETLSRNVQERFVAFRHPFTISRCIIHLLVTRRHSTTLLSTELSSLTNRLRETEVRLKRARRASMRMQAAQASAQQLHQIHTPGDTSPVRPQRPRPNSLESGEASNTSGSETGEELKGIEEQEEEE